MFRRRKIPSKQSEARGGEGFKSSSKDMTSQTNLYNAANNIVGLLVMILLSYHFSSYLYQLHENDMWFSEIMVSKTECCLGNRITIILYRKLREKFLFELSKDFIILTSNNSF